MPSKWTYVASLPDCDLCKMEAGPVQKAEYDGKTVHGPWAFMCTEHFEAYGTGLGIGHGQRLVLREEEPGE